MRRFRITWEIEWEGETPGAAFADMIEAIFPNGWPAPDSANFVVSEERVLRAGYDTGGAK